MAESGTHFSPANGLYLDTLKRVTMTTVAIDKITTDENDCDPDVAVDTMIPTALAIGNFAARVRYSPPIPFDWTWAGCSTPCHAKYSASHTNNDVNRVNLQKVGSTGYDCLEFTSDVVATGIVTATVSLHGPLADYQISNAVTYVPCSLGGVPKIAMVYFAGGDLYIWDATSGKNLPFTGDGIGGKLIIPVVDLTSCMY